MGPGEFANGDGAGGPEGADAPVDDILILRCRAGIASDEENLMLARCLLQFPSWGEFLNDLKADDERDFCAQGGNPVFEVEAFRAFARQTSLRMLQDFEDDDAGIPHSLLFSILGANQHAHCDFPDGPSVDRELLKRALTIQDSRAPDFLRAMSMCERYRNWREALGQLRAEQRQKHRRENGQETDE